MIISLSKSGTYYYNGTEITETEYNNILAIIRNKPTAPTGFSYRLTDDLEWELYELPIANSGDEDLTADEALAIIIGGDST